MKKLIFAFLAAASVLTFSCKNEAKVNLDAEKQALRLTADSLLQALASKDAEQFIDLYINNAIYINPENIFHGKDEIQQYYIKGFSLPGFSLTGQVQEVQVFETGILGYTIIPYDMQWTSETGEQIKQHGTNLLVWEKQADDSWKVLIDKPR